VGDSHLRGFAAYMKVFLNNQFEVCGYVRPGALSKMVMGSAKSDIKNSQGTILILCCLSNDVNNNNLRKVFYEVTTLVNSTSI
jgi:hypothetical protein